MNAQYNMGISLNKIGRKTEVIEIYIKSKYFKSPNYLSMENDDDI